METKENKKRIFKVVLKGDNYETKAKQFWSREEDTLLNLVETEKLKGKKVHWEDISLNFNKDSKQCYARYRQINPFLKKGYWSKDEEKKLIELVKASGPKWAEISKQFGSRSGKQIRQHYRNICDERLIKAKLTEDEHKLLVDLYKQYGPQWQFISTFFNGRTADNLKCRYNNYMRRIKKTVNINPENIKLVEDTNQISEKLDGKSNANNNNLSISLPNSTKFKKFLKITRRKVKIDNAEGYNSSGENNYMQEKYIEKMESPCTEHINENNLNINNNYCLGKPLIFKYNNKNSMAEKKKFNEKEYESNINNSMQLENNYINIKYTSESTNPGTNYLSKIISLILDNTNGDYIIYDVISNRHNLDENLDS